MNHLLKRVVVIATSMDVDGGVVKLQQHTLLTGVGKRGGGNFFIYC
jgi:hypothetical protein